MHIFTAHAQKRLFRNFRSKKWPHHWLRRPRFLIRQMYFHYRVTFTGHIRCLCATTSHDLVTLTFWPWEWFMYNPLISDTHTCNFYYPTTISYWVTISLLKVWSHCRLLEHPHVKAIFGRKKNQVQKPEVWTPKGTSLPGTTSFDVFCVKIRSGV